MLANCISEYEFGMLAGTELMIDLIKNKVVFEATMDNLNAVLSFMENSATGMYYARQQGNTVTVYCENPIDKNNITIILGQN